MARSKRKPDRAEQTPRRPWYLAVWWYGDGETTMAHYFSRSVDAHMDDKWPDPPPTRDEMQHVMHAAKMEMARQIVKRARKSGKSAR